ncbi:MAG: hypothetical protein HN936_12750 [Bacteroidetes bacterium]|jgi:hypothetical protein|nr:hypothetical protein [Bacteroidota bacterium]
MITINKQDVGNWLLLEYLSDLYTVREKLHLFEQKYKQPWETFEANIASGKEDFSIWDDYIEWKAYIKTGEELSSKIDEVRHGNFKVA